MTEGQTPSPVLDVAQLMRCAFELHRDNRLVEAGQLYRQVLTSEPANANALHMLGVVEAQLDHHELSAELIGRAVEINPAHPAAHYNLANTLRELNRFEEALLSYDRALNLGGDDPAVLNNRGAVLSALNRLQEALSSYDRAIALRPDHVEAHNNRGNALLALARYDEAAASYEKALTLQPLHAGALFGRGKALSGLHKPEQALVTFARAISVKPDHIDSYIQRMELLVQLRRSDEALRECDKAIVVAPLSAFLHQKRADILFMLGRAQDSFAAYDRAFSLDPELPDLEGARLITKMYVCDWTNLDDELARLISGVRQAKHIAAPFTFLVADVGPREHLLCAHTYAAARYPANPSPLWNGEKYRHAKIRIGYVSGEFREQATAYLAADLFECHDRNRFELHAVSTGIDDKSPRRSRIKAAFDSFYDARGHTDLEIAQAIRRAEIDILVNLNGYFGEERTGVFALKPSPCQVNYLGFPGTMGVTYMDYIIADKWVIPEDHRESYAENVVYLPDTYQATDRKKIISEHIPSRAECGLPEEGFVFCSFSSAYKITPQIFDIWMRLLSKTAGSVLWLLELHSAIREKLRREAAERGVSPDRIVFAPFIALKDHLARGRLADLFLDTLPVNAHTTASDALWMGVPVLTCLGASFASRVAASLLSAVGLDELIARSLDEYESLAVKLARDPALLVDIRAKLVRNRDSYPLFDTPRFTRHIEAAYMHMWERQQQDLPPAGFSVNPT